MSMIQDPQLGGWNLKDSDMLRKSIAKKDPQLYEQLTQKYFDTVAEKHLDWNICNYFWSVLVNTQRGYSFNLSHVLAYSIVGLQNMNLACNYPIIFWNTANLIVDSAGVDEDEDEDEDESEDIKETNELDEENDEINIEKDNDEKTKAQVNRAKKTIDYGKTAKAIGRFRAYGIKILPPDINKSSFTFTPNVEENSITYGLRGITRISNEVIKTIIKNRPYSSLQDFLVKNKTNKLQTLNLIKSGAFDSIEQIPREQIMHNYIDSIADKKQRLTLQNMQMLINKELIPDEMSFYAQLFLFNKFLKSCKNDIYYDLNEAAINFISDHFDADLIDNGTQISQKKWDSSYKKAMEPMRDYLKEHKDEMLAKLNQALYDEVAEKYTEGNISSWEMSSLSFYYHDHELAKYVNDYDNFFDLPEEPEIDYSFETKDGNEIKMYKLHQIIGTVIDKDKNRNTITLLTPQGVVNVKIYKNQFALFDKQISVRDQDGEKHIIEKSWFTRGTKLMVQGIRRGNDYVPKKYRQSVFPVVSKIIGEDENGKLKFQFERMEVE